MLYVCFWTLYGWISGIPVFWFYVKNILKGKVNKSMWTKISSDTTVNISFFHYFRFCES